MHQQYTLNEYLEPALDNYLIHGIQPGSFMTAVLCNDLHGAINRADSGNLINFALVCNEIIHRCPPDAFGSEQHVRDWIHDVDRRRSEYANGLMI